MKNFVEVDIFLSTAQRNRHSLSEKRFPPFRLRVSVVDCKVLDICLLSTDTPVAEVAQQTGFSDISLFSRVFKQAVGLPPAAYRKNITGNND